MAGKALKALTELAAKAKGKAVRPEVEEQLNAYMVAKRMAEANRADAPAPADFLDDMTNEERLALLDKAGWDTSRALWFAGKRRPSSMDRPYIEPSPELAFMKDSPDSGTLRLLLGAENMTPEELAGNYTYNRLMKPPREGYRAYAAKREYEELKAKYGAQQAADWMFDADLPAVYPVFTRKDAPAMFDSGWSTQRSIEDLISVYGLPGEEGKFKKGGLVKGFNKGGLNRVIKKYFGDDDLPVSLRGTEIVKDPGGNWLAGSVERAVEPMKRKVSHGRMANTGIPPGTYDLGGEIMQINDDYSTLRWAPSDYALNTWLDKKLAKYIRNEMATERDPVRLQAEAFAQQKAELLAAKDAQIAKAVADMERERTARGFTPEMMTRSQAQIRELRKERALIEAQRGLHVSPEQLPFRNRQVHLGGEQFPTVARTPEALQWERASDFAVSPTKAGAYLEGADDWVPVTVGSNNALENNPWLSKVPPETPVYSLTEAGRLSEDLGFSHLVDELSNALNPESGLPTHLLLDTDNLGKLNIADAVRRVDAINAWRATQKAEADRLRANNAATTLVKEYPDDPRGLRWVEMRMPETMPEGWAEEFIETDLGRLRKFRDPKTGKLGAADPREDALKDALKYEGEVMQHCVGGYCPDVVEGRSRIYSLRDAEGHPYTTIEVKPGDDDLAPRIHQIKGFRNEAPASEYLPFVQDFVRSQQWSDVRDLENAGLMTSRFDPATLARYGKEHQPYVTQAELDDIMAAMDAASSAEGYARGGRVKGIVDTLKGMGVDSSFEYRTQLFSRLFPGEAYTGSAAQNNRLTAYLRGGYEAPEEPKAERAIPEPRALNVRQPLFDRPAAEPYQRDPSVDAIEGVYPELNLLAAGKVAQGYSVIRPNPARVSTIRTREAREPERLAKAAKEYRQEHVVHPYSQNFAKGGQVKPEAARYQQGGIIDFDADRIDQMAQQLASEIYG